MSAISRWIRAIAITVALASSVARTASAQDDATTQAHAEFDRGLQLMEETRFADAVLAFEHSLALHRTGTAEYNLGLALRGLGAYRRAMTAFDRFAALPTADPTLAAQARTISAELAQLLGHLVLHVRGSSEDVTVDGVRVASGDGDVDMTVDPGHRNVEAHRRGYRPARASVDLANGQRLELTLDAGADVIVPVVSIETDYRGGELVVDGEIRGALVWRGELPVGSHRIELRHGSTVLASRTLDLVAGAHERVVLTVRVSSPLYTRWWFWAGAFAVTAAGVAGIVYYDVNNVAPYELGSIQQAFQAITRR